MNQLSIFKNCDNISIPGLSYITEYVESEQELALISIIDTKPWIVELKRKTQHYGYKYDYKSRSIDPSHYIGLVPDWLQQISERLYCEGVFHKIPDQVIINEYEPGQGISAHIDCIPCFDKVICSLSLGSTCVMNFTRNDVKKSILLKPRSLLILKDEARYSWKHGIAARKSDKFQGISLFRNRRISLTFRSTLQDQDKWL